ncbi:MAG TPA: divergent PAP2 family protein [Anaerolineales bacterium]|nr:divergent PAP2 family protein [Anaerolineales bacterium]
MSLLALFDNRALVACMIAWGLAQALKLPIEYALTRTWDWSLLLRAGGMPSSHSALVSAAAHAIGLTEGFDSPIFALAIAIAMVVIYDATGIRRQAGRHAEIINAMVRDLVEGHPLRQEQLREVLGHSPFEAFVGLVMGILVAQLTIMLWPA